MRVLFDHVGYEPDEPKPILLEAPEDTRWGRVEAVDLSGRRPPFPVAPRFVGGVAGWSVGPWWRIDLDGLTAPGRHAIRWSHTLGAGQSEGFDIAPGVQGWGLVSDLVGYFKGQRSSGIWDLADRSVPRFGDGVRRDVHGGWFDASGDTSKYLSHLSYAGFMNPQQTPLVVWVLARAWATCRERGAPGHLVERIRDEALHGADWLVRMQDPEGFWYETVFDGWTKDPLKRELCSYRTQQGIRLPGYRAGWRSGGGMAVAALALASGLGPGGEYPPETYISTARRGYEHLRAHATGHASDGRLNLIDDTCALLAAVELHAAAPDAGAGVDLEPGARALLGRRGREGGIAWLRADDEGSRSWFHASDAGLPPVVLQRLIERFPDFPDARGIRESVLELAGSQLALCAVANNPFAYPPHWVRTPQEAGRLRWFYPHENPSGYWWQGENARLGSLAAAARGAARLAGDGDPLAGAARQAARRWIAWILGANPFDVCMLHGRGRNNPEYAPGYHNAAGGVCNGITSGFGDEEDIAFLPAPQGDLPEHRWRWAEQWLPHAAWLLHALLA